MDGTTKDALWQQFGAATGMLENTIHACPQQLWEDRTRRPQFWYLVFHTLFFVDLYLSDSSDGFSPPAPFTRSELDPRGVLPDRAYSKEELLTYLEHCRSKARTRINGLNAESGARVCRFGWIDLTTVESLIYNMRHVQHHAAQLNLLLRQAACEPPDWVPRVDFP